MMNGGAGIAIDIDIDLPKPIELRMGIFLLALGTIYVFRILVALQECHTSIFSFNLLLLYYILRSNKSTDKEIKIN